MIQSVNVRQRANYHRNWPNDFGDITIVSFFLQDGAIRHIGLGAHFGTTREGYLPVFVIVQNLIGSAIVVVMLRFCAWKRLHVFMPLKRWFRRHLRNGISTRPHKAYPCIMYRQNPSICTGEARSQEWIKKKIEKVSQETESCDMSLVRQDHSCTLSQHSCMGGLTPDVVVYSKFHRNPFKDFRATGVENRSSPLYKYNNIRNKLPKNVYFKFDRTCENYW